jgi:hypothetical protein
MLVLPAFNSGLRISERYEEFMEKHEKEGTFTIK